MNTVAVLLTCHNRKEKTIKCLTSLFKAIEGFKHSNQFHIYLVDDGCTDGTNEEVREHFFCINIIKGSGDLYWAGGMRLAWETALNNAPDYDFFLLLNDDVILKDSFLNDLLSTHDYCIQKFNQGGIYVCSTMDTDDSKVSYGGTLILKKGIRVKSKKVSPGNVPILCSMANANILMVSKDVVNAIGIFDKKYTHLFADYDYTLAASKRGIPVLVSTGIGGFCEDDHGDRWLSSGSTLGDRIRYLYSLTGLSYREQIYFVKKNFKYQLPYNFLMLWLKTFFPILWNKFKKNAKLTKL